ncbi:unnamed protein product, partial [Symbiodinium microadriaticum]
AGHLPFARTETRGFVRNRDQNVSRLMDEASNVGSPRNDRSYSHLHNTFSRDRRWSNSAVREAGSFMSEENPTEGNRTSNRRSFYGPIGGATPQE